MEGGMAALRLRGMRLVKSSMGKGLGWGVQFWDVTSSLRGSLHVIGRSQVTEKQELLAARAVGSAGNDLGLQWSSCWHLVGNWEQWGKEQRSMNVYFAKVLVSQGNAKWCQIWKLPLVSSEKPYYAQSKTLLWTEWNVLFQRGTDGLGKNCCIFFALVKISPDGELAELIQFLTNRIASWCSGPSFTKQLCH